MKNGGTPKSSAKKPPTASKPIDTHAAQCENCLKWRVIDSVEEYEEIRSKLIEEPFVCERKPGLSCGDPADIEYNATSTWAIDKPGFPKTPQGFKRGLRLRGDSSRMDAYYETQTGKKLRSPSEVAAFLAANPQIERISLDNFNFTTPKVMEETIPGKSVKQTSSVGNKKS